MMFGPEKSKLTAYNGPLYRLEKLVNTQIKPIDSEIEFKASINIRSSIAGSDNAK